MRNVDYSNYLQMTPSELYSLQKTKGWTMSFVGFIAYHILLMFGFMPKAYNGICEYFEVGTHWGAVSLGYFFVCEKGCSDYIKCHEYGHCIQNAAVGGLVMFFYCAASAFRCLWRKIFPSKRSYYDWFFEGDASKIGCAYVKRITSNKKE